MLPQHNPMFSPIDLTTQRTLDQIAALVNDIEHRILAVRVTLSQVAPQLGVVPHGLGSPVAPGFPSGLVAGQVSPFGGSSLATGLHVGVGLPQALPGVMAPFGTFGTVAPYSPFRLG